MTCTNTNLSLLPDIKRKEFNIDGSRSVKCYHFEQHFVKLESIEFHRKYDMFIYSSINMFSFSMGNENGLSLWKN